MQKLIFIVLISTLCSCAYSVPSYVSSASTSSALKSGSRQVTVVASPAVFNDDGTIICRGTGVVSLGKERLFSDYIVEAIKNDLKTYGLLDPLSPNIITIQLNNVDASSALGEANWYIDATYTIEGKIIDVNTVYNDRSSFFRSRACNNMALYFQKAVATHLKQLYANPDFRAAIGQIGLEGPSSDRKHRLQQLQELMNGGLITEEEYKEKRKKILNEL